MKEIMINGSEVLFVVVILVSVMVMVQTQTLGIIAIIAIANGANDVAKKAIKQIGKTNNFFAKLVQVLFKIKGK